MEPGRLAIDAALERCYPTKRDHRMGFQPEPGEEFPPLAEVVAFSVAHPVPHWHYISYGLSELGPKESKDPELSGWGFELTMRVAGSAEFLPMWPFNFLRWIAMTVWRDGDALGENHSFFMPEGMLKHYQPDAHALGFTIDEVLGRIYTLNGNVTFLQIVDLHADEYRLTSRWNIHGVFDAIRAITPRFVWLPSRPSVLAGPAGEVLCARADEEGSSQGLQTTRELAWKDGSILLDPMNRHIVANGLQYRVSYGRELIVYSGDEILELHDGPHRTELDENIARVWIPASEAAAIAAALRAGSDHAPFVCIDGMPVPASM